MLSMQYNDRDTGQTHELPQTRIQMAGLSFEVVDRYKDSIYRTALTVTGNFADAEDIMQDVFLQYFQSHPAFDTPAHEKAWLIRCTVNAGRNLLRSAWHHKRSDVDLTMLPVSDDGEEGESDVLAEVLRLPERYRTAIYLYYYESYTVKEIAQITGRSAAAVSQHLSRGRNKLRKRLEQNGKGGTQR